MHSLPVALWGTQQLLGLSIGWDDDQLTGLPGIWTQEVPIGSPASATGTWSNDAFASDPITSIDFFVDDIQINEPGEVSFSDANAATGTWAFSYSSKLFTDDRPIVACVTRQSGAMATASVIVRMNFTDPTRLASGHPRPDASDWTWVVVPQFRADASLPVATTTGFGGGVLVSGTPLQVQLNADIASGTEGEHTAHMSIQVPDGVTLRVVTLLDGGTVDNRDFVGPILIANDATNATLPVQDVFDGELLEYNFQAFGGSAVIQYMQIDYAATGAGSPTVLRDESTVEVGANDTVINSGSWGHTGGGITTLSVDVGNLTQNGDGTWDWDHTPTFEEHNDTVTITATDGSETTQVTFTMTVYNALYIDIEAGSDANDGKSPGLALATPGQAAEIAEGDDSINAILAKAGQTMPSGDNAHEPATRLKANSVRFDNLTDVLISTWGGPGVFVVDGDGENIFGATPSSHPNASQGLIDVRNGNDIILQNWGAINSSHSGIAVRSRSSGSSGGVTVQNCVINRTGGHGLLAINQEAGGGPSNDVLTNITFQWNQVQDACLNVESLGLHNAGGEAVTFQGVENSAIRHNHIFSNHKETIDVKNGCRRIKVHGNYCHSQFVGGVYDQVNSGASIYIDAFAKWCEDIEIYHNLSVREGAGIVVGSEDGGNTQRVHVHDNIVVFPEEAGFTISGSSETGNPGTKHDVDCHNNHFISAKPDKFVVTNSESLPSRINNFRFQDNLCARTVSSSLPIMNSAAGLSSHGIHNNLVWQNGDAVTGTGDAPVLGDPKFVTLLLDFWKDDPFADNPAWPRPTVMVDFAIAIGSAAADAAAHQLSEVDIKGDVRTAPQSIGAIENAM